MCEVRGVGSALCDGHDAASGRRSAAWAKGEWRREPDRLQPGKSAILSAGRVILLALAGTGVWEASCVQASIGVAWHRVSRAVLNSAPCFELISLSAQVDRMSLILTMHRRS